MFAAVRDAYNAPEVPEIPVAENEGVGVPDVTPDGGDVAIFDVDRTKKKSDTEG